MPTVQDVLEEKATKYVHTIVETASVLAAIKKMIQYRIGCLVVTRDDKTISGIIAERDVVRRMATVQQDLSQVPVGDVMTREVIVCTVEDSLNRVRSIMSTRWIRQMPVVDPDGKLLGIVSMGDVNAYQITKDNVEISFLHDYIEGKVR